jgi:hypothetical protein
MSVFFYFVVNNFNISRFIVHLFVANDNEAMTLHPLRPMRLGIKKQASKCASLLNTPIFVA